jgi:coniferyl-aldehyde dehydrogenase
MLCGWGSSLEPRLYRVWHRGPTIRAMNAPHTAPNAHPIASAMITADLDTLFAAQHRASRSMIDVSLAWRLERLERLQNLIDTHGPALADAVQSDFGVRSRQLTDVADYFVLLATLSQLKAQCAKWMKPQRVSTPIYLQQASAHIQRQPLGVVGIIGPWNYPLQLTLGPLATALAAGNRAMIKPSELTPRSSALLADLLHSAFSADEVAVVLGGPDVANAFASLPFDHLFFTGSTAVGRKVAEAAARNLTPTTLELGGKSPCIVDASCSAADMAGVALKIAHGKLINAGQTCIAPDYVLLPEGREGEFEQAFAHAVGQLFPTLVGNTDYASIVSERHFARLQGLLDEVQAHGARVAELQPAAQSQMNSVANNLNNPSRPNADASRQMAPVLVFNPPAQSRLMNEEIFGPILPVLTYRTLADAVAHINARPRPLALYWFGTDSTARDQILSQTVSGGVTINDTLLHIAHHNLPFGGVGESGWGSYHGEAGFLRFTQQKPVLVQSRWAMGHLFYPPYGPRFQQVMGLLKRWL